MLGMSIGLAIGCSNDDPGTHFCVGDKRDSQNCTVTWELVDPCGMVPSFSSVEIALFDGGCPDVVTLRNGDTSTAVVHGSFEPNTPFAAIEGVDTVMYGFAFVARDDQCIVRAYGCTGAHLGDITTIRTGVCDWSAQDENGVSSCACKPLDGAPTSCP